MSDPEVHRADDIGRGRRDQNPRGDRTLGFHELAIITLVAVFAVFAALNFDDAHVDLIFDTVTLPLIVAIIGCFGLGVLVGWLVSRRQVRRTRKD